MASPQANNAVPSASTPVVAIQPREIAAAASGRGDRVGGLITPAWLRFFTLLLSQPGPIAAVALTGSPFSFTASERGTAFVVGGTVSVIKITRARVTITTGQTSGNVPLAQGDTLIVTYSAAPTVSFVPG